MINKSHGTWLCVVPAYKSVVAPGPVSVLKVPNVFGWHNSLCIFKTKASRATKLWSYFNSYSLYYNIWKEQLYRMRGNESRVTDSNPISETSMRLIHQSPHFEPFYNCSWSPGPTSGKKIGSRWVYAYTRRETTAFSRNRGLKQHTTFLSHGRKNGGVLFSSLSCLLTTSFIVWSIFLWETIG